MSRLIEDLSRRKISGICCFKSSKLHLWM